MSDLADKHKTVDKKDHEISKAREHLNELEREIVKYREQNRLFKLESEEKDLELDSLRHKQRDGKSNTDSQVIKIKEQLKAEQNRLQEMEDYYKKEIFTLNDQLQNSKDEYDELKKKGYQKL